MEGKHRIICKGCGKEKFHHAKGFCFNCYIKDYNFRNKDKIVKRHRKYYFENKDIISVRTRERRQKNIKKIRESRRLYYLENKGRITKWRKTYYQKNKEKILARAKELRRGNKEEFRKLRKLQYQKNRNKILKRQKEYNLKNKDMISKRSKERYRNNIEKIRIRQKETYQKHREKILQYAKEYRERPEVKKYQKLYGKKWLKEHKVEMRKYHREYKHKMRLKLYKELGIEPVFKKRYRTNDGHIVDSIGEVIIDNWLFINRIPHITQPKICEESKRRGDFKIEDYYIEYIGFSTVESIQIRERYIRRFKEKITLYQKCNKKLIIIAPSDLKNINKLLGFLIQHSIEQRRLV